MCVQSEKNPISLFCVGFYAKLMAIWWYTHTYTQFPFENRLKGNLLHQFFFLTYFYTTSGCVFIIAYRKILWRFFFVVVVVITLQHFFFLLLENREYTPPFITYYYHLLYDPVSECAPNNTKDTRNSGNNVILSVYYWAFSNNSITSWADVKVLCVCVCES